MKPNCYDCKWRRNIPGDAHSMCIHPATGIREGANMFSGLVQSMGKGMVEGVRKLNIKANAHGVRSGWFMWPANFDPIWLENCDGFAQVKKEP